MLLYYLEVIYILMRLFVWLELQNFYATSHIITKLVLEPICTIFCLRDSTLKTSDSSKFRVAHLALIENDTWYNAIFYALILINVCSTL